MRLTASSYFEAAAIVAVFVPLWLRQDTKLTRAARRRARGQERVERLARKRPSTRDQEGEE